MQAEGLVKRGGATYISNQVAFALFYIYKETGYWETEKNLYRRFYYRLRIQGLNY